MNQDEFFKQRESDRSDSTKTLSKARIKHGIARQNSVNDNVANQGHSKLSKKESKLEKESSPTLLVTKRKTSLFNPPLTNKLET